MSTPEAAKGLKILVVDDNVDSAKIMALLLKMQGHDVQAAFSATSALETAATFAPQAVLLDIGLPIMNGYEVAKRLREAPGGDLVTLIAVSGFSDSEHVARAEKAGFDEQLVKPVDPASMTKALVAATAARRNRVASGSTS
ncbi:MAG TPA: response regulator [Pirellulales bacterium]